MSSVRFFLGMYPYVALTSALIYESATCLRAAACVVRDDYDDFHTKVFAAMSVTSAIASGLASALCKEVYDNNGRITHPEQNDPRNEVACWCIISMLSSGIAITSFQTWISGCQFLSVMGLSIWLLLTLLFICVDLWAVSRASTEK
jgi:hypothetical protein